MELIPTFIFLAVVFVGSYVQAVTGFAMAMLIVALVGGLRLVELPTLAAVVSLLTILNVILALRGQTQHVYRSIFKWLAVGQVPGILFGVYLLTWLDNSTQWVLELCLGVFILVGGLSMWLKPHPWPEPANPWASLLTGLAGGTVGGMFSASGPVLGWFAYNQPLPLAAIRATLLASFVLTTSTRTIVVGVSGGLTQEVWLLALIGLPVVVVGTWLGNNMPPPVTENIIKKMANVLLLVMGAWILIRMFI